MNLSTPKYLSQLEQLLLPGISAPRLPGVSDLEQLVTLSRAHLELGRETAALKVLMHAGLSLLKVEAQERAKSEEESLKRQWTLVNANLKRFGDKFQALACLGANTEARARPQTSVEEAANSAKTILQLATSKRTKRCVQDLVEIGPLSANFLIAAYSDSRQSAAARTCSGRALDVFCLPGSKLNDIYPIQELKPIPSSPESLQEAGMAWHNQLPVATDAYLLNEIEVATYSNDEVRLIELLGNLGLRRLGLLAAGHEGSQWRWTGQVCKHAYISPDFEFLHKGFYINFKIANVDLMKRFIPVVLDKLQDGTLAQKTGTTRRLRQYIPVVRGHSPELYEQMQTSMFGAFKDLQLGTKRAAKFDQNEIDYVKNLVFSLLPYRGELQKLDQELRAMKSNEQSGRWCSVLARTMLKAARKD